jgi:hypothetical protein
MPITAKSKIVEDKKIKNFKVLEKEFVTDRWYAVLDKPFYGRRRVPYAHYVWLFHNPSFLNIPKDYVIHHLDWDKTNDDISNLALMQRLHHAAHHWKNNIVAPKINMSKLIANDNAVTVVPTREPSIGQRKDRGTYYVHCYERVDGKAKARKLTRYNGKVIQTIEQAQILKAALVRNMEDYGA